MASRNRDHSFDRLRHDRVIESGAGNAGSDREIEWAQEEDVEPRDRGECFHMIERRGSPISGMTRI